jgi:hypothetical protein
VTDRWRYAGLVFLAVKRVLRRTDHRTLRDHQQYAGTPTSWKSEIDPLKIVANGSTSSRHMRRQLRVGTDRDLHFALRSPKDSTEMAENRDAGATLVKRLFFPR